MRVQVLGNAKSRACMPLYISHFERTYLELEQREKQANWKKARMRSRRLHEARPSNKLRTATSKSLFNFVSQIMFYTKTWSALCFRVSNIVTNS